MRALFEVALRKSWAIMAARLLQFCKVIERQLWGFESPLHQFPHLGVEILRKLDARKISVDKLRDMDAKDIGKRDDVRLTSTSSESRTLVASVRVMTSDKNLDFVLCTKCNLDSVFCCLMYTTIHRSSR